MLKQLYIRNFTLIDELQIAFRPGFSVITGETGAGKSIILGAIGLLLGNRADTKVIKSGQTKCVIEAHFDLSGYDRRQFFIENDIDYEPEDCILRREINAGGKSRSFINDTPVALSAMKDLGEQLVDIHSQHQNLMLNKEDFQLKVIDTLAQDDVQLTAYRTAFNGYRDAEKRLNAMRKAINESRNNEDFLRFQLKELTEAQLDADEQTSLERESSLLKHAEEIKSTLYSANQILAGDDDGIVESLNAAADQLQNIEQMYPDVADLATRLDSCYIDLKDISREIETQLETIDFDPRRLATVNERLDTLYSLQHKFHVESVSELIQIADRLQTQINSIDNSDEELKEQEAKVAQYEAECRELARDLTTRRIAAARRIEQEMRERLMPLGIPNVRFEIQMTEKLLADDGADQVAFLFSANRSTPMQSVSDVASGGEIARVMLSLKAMISGTVKLPTIIFDEIDTGVSGRVAEQMARMMCEMGGQHRQVISITHLPQIAAQGVTHYKVSKEETAEGTISRMHELDNDQRVREIAQMLSGSDVTEAAITNAKALLKI